MELRIKLIDKKDDPIGGVVILKFSVESPMEGTLLVEVPLDLAKRLPEKFAGEALLTTERPSPGERDLLMSTVVYQSGENALRASAYGLLVILEFKGAAPDLAGFSRGDEVYLLVRDIASARS